MPIPEDKLRKPERLNRWFAISSVLMTVSIVWMIWVDFDRPWRVFQDQFFVGKAALAHLDYLEAMRQERQQEIETAKRRLEDAKELVVKSTGEKQAKLRSDLAESDLEFNKVNGYWSRLSQVLDVTKDTYEKVSRRYGPNDSATRSAKQQLQSEEEEVEGLRKEKEKWEDAKARIERELKQLEEPVRLADRKLRDLMQAQEAALQKDQQFRGVLSDAGLLGGLPIVGAIINMPMLDFAAPKTTPSRQQVKQLVLPDVRQRLNYLESYTTDRCTTCHIAIDDPEFSQDRLARKLERSLPGINEALQRMGQQPFDLPAPLTPDGSNKPLPTGAVTEHWGELSPEQQEAYFDALLGLYNKYLKQSGRKTIDLGQPLLAHPHLDLFVSVNSTHPMQKMGCTVCHEGNPQETDFVFAAHTPPTHDIEKQWEEEYYVRVAGVPRIDFETMQHYWDRPMRLPKYTEAGCVKCHRDVSDISRFQDERVGTRINLGRHLFTAVGCVNCHDDDALQNARKVGPDLSHVAAKLKPEFVQQWVFFPQKFRPSTRMPHFFQQENNRAESHSMLDSQPLLRTETEVAAMAQYLFAVSTDWKPIEKPADVQGDGERGRKLFDSVGCLACHANLAEFGEEWIVKDIARRDGIAEEKARHRFKGMTYEQQVTYALEHFADERDTFLHPDRVRPSLDEAEMATVFTRFAPELSGIGSKVNAAWLYSWLIEPTHYAPDTKMPSLRLTPEEAGDLTAYLMSLKNDDFVQGEFELTPARRQMADELVFTLLSALRSERRSRSIMNDEGHELSDMLVNSLKGSLGEREARDRVSSMSPDDKRLMYLGSSMISHYGCYACHLIKGFEKATPPGTELSEWAEKPISQLDFAFYDDAFHDLREEKEETYSYLYPQDAKELNRWSPTDDRQTEEITHTHAAFAKHKMLNPRIWDREKLKKPYDKLKMPNFYFSEDEAEAITTYLLSRVPPRVSDALKIDYQGDALGAIAHGRDLTRELNCVACHQLEDNVPTIQQYFRRTVAGKTVFDSTNAPPLLWGEGAKVQHNWLHGFFQQVVPLRPWLQVRMPSFTLTGDQATVLTEYFAALSQHDSSKLKLALAPVREYVKSAVEEAAKAEKKKAAEAPGSDWYERDALETNAEELGRFAVERKLMRPADLDSLRSPPDRLRAAYGSLLKRVEFLQQLYNVKYPFVEPPKPVESPERVTLGSQFLTDMGCLKCHVLGNMLPGPAKNTEEFAQMYRLDGVRGEGSEAVALLNGRPYRVGATIDRLQLVSAENVYYDTGDVETKAVIEGPSATGETERILLVAPSAPNLSLTYQRLRRTWVHDWMLEPQWIQAGTKMPQNFPRDEKGEPKSPFAGDAKYPGTSAEHVDLLVDYLYYAGANGVRAAAPKAIAAAPQEFEEGGSKPKEFED